MSTQRIFTEAELKEMGARTRDLIDDAIDKGELEKAKRLSHRMYAESLYIHDLYLDWSASLLSYIYDHFGDEVLYDALKQSCTPFWKPVCEMFEKEKDFRRKVEMFAMALRGHLQPLEFEEDDEKVCITCRPCGSGERLIREGAYGPPKNFSMVKKPQLITYGKADFPVYCTHEPILEILSMEWSGYPTIVFYCADDMRAGGCRFCFYKHLEAIPEVAYTKLGKKKEKA